MYSSSKDQCYPMLPVLAKLNETPCEDVCWPENTENVKKDGKKKKKRKKEKMGRKKKMCRESKKDEKKRRLCTVVLSKFVTEVFSFCCKYEILWEQPY